MIVTLCVDAFCDESRALIVIAFVPMLSGIAGMAHVEDAFAVP